MNLDGIKKFISDLADENAALKAELSECMKSQLDMQKRLLHTQDMTINVKEAGRKGGRAKVPKGIAALPKKKRKAAAQKAARARWAKKAPQETDEEIAARTGYDPNDDYRK